MATARLVLDFALPNRPPVPPLTSSIEPSFSYGAALSRIASWGGGGEGIADGHISADDLHLDLVFSVLSVAEPGAIGVGFPLGSSHRIRIPVE